MNPMIDGELTIRKAAKGDLDAIARIMNYPPEPPMEGLLGRQRASRFGEFLVLRGAVLSLAHSWVAVAGGSVIGVVECGLETGGNRSLGAMLRLLPRALWIAGRKIPRVLYGMRLQGRVEFERAPGAFVVAQLYVDEAARNRGIGGRLLDHAEALAHESGAHQMTIETGIANPARRLYERKGYRLIATKANGAYERMTGSPGRVLMAKDI